MAVPRSHSAKGHSILVSYILVPDPPSTKRTIVLPTLSNMHVSVSHKVSKKRKNLIFKKRKPPKSVNFLVNFYINSLKENNAVPFLFLPCI